MADKSVAIIGAGIAGLSAGIYAQMNGYSSKIFEMHTQPGGLMTGWKRKDYTIEGCIHWLVGSSSAGALYPYWREIGLIQNRKIVYLDEFSRYEGRDGRTFIFYTDINRLEKHMLGLSAEDEAVIKEFTGVARKLSEWDMPIDSSEMRPTSISGIRNLIKGVKYMPIMQKYLKITMKQFTKKFKDDLLREALLHSWPSDFSLLFLMMTLAWMHRKDAGYPIGGSLPMAKALEQRYCSLGGEIHYGCRVDNILVEQDRAVGVRLDDGRQFRADTVISAADGKTTIFKMLEGKYVGKQIQEIYDTYGRFEALLYIGLGINRSFSDEPMTVSGYSIPLDEPITLGSQTVDRITLHPYNYDPTMAPEGKTTVVVMLENSYQYWKDLYDTDSELYNAKKQEAGERIIQVLDKRYPGAASQVEMCNVATPVTFERYTGNWGGSMEGFLMTPETSMKPIPKTLPGLENFYMVGQWVQPGGGLPSGVMTARSVIQTICKKDRVPFQTMID
jgi:phytoene dehydrogenase-like protein